MGLMRCRGTTDSVTGTPRRPAWITVIVRPLRRIQDISFLCLFRCLSAFRLPKRPVFTPVFLFSIAFQSCLPLGELSPVTPAVEAERRDPEYLGRVDPY
jgi:hypothetical protein